MKHPAGSSVPADRRAGGHRRSSPPGNRTLVPALAITQTIGYGTLYYAFVVFLVPIAADLHTSTTAVTGAFTASVLTSAVLAVPLGRRLDRHGGRTLMTCGSLLGTMLLVGWSHVGQVWQLYAVQIGIGVASAASLYEAAFAVIIAWCRPERRSRALLTLTAVAGFASTIFLPLTGWLTDQHGWRTTLLILAGIHAITAPLHAATVRRPPAATNLVTRHRDVDASVVRAALADRAFWVLTAGFTTHAMAISAYTVLLVAALTTWGHPPAFAATIAGLLGVLSVTGRLITTSLQSRYRTTTITAGIFAIQAAAALLLPAVGASTGGAIVAVVGFGLGFGVATIAKPVILAERYDTRRYATLAGVLVAPMTLAKAGAPLGAATLHRTTGGYTSVFTAIAVCCAVAAAAIGVCFPGPRDHDIGGDGVHDE
ncbi:MFS transporter [Actinoplanes sp. SE50]|uniref:MFS transporter n=1 Tax=unclassified Actinoplanes TaxID=2626549 RepID=UPI00023ED0B0|nr:MULTISPECIES: MFS transporter [unclassified Actinoplanes]AEV85533.1 Monocarboxylate transporter 2 [Actinoplanes sp. SE50/110]ATO83926.1 MFS transporter [Actinoplanes sp. SE50]SLM01336.1 MFS transporter [Actinoplanes sp. SE50/110]